MIRAEYFMREPRVAHSSMLIRDPDVSIILPTYCRGDNGLLKRAIESVLAQSFSSFELIVMDDGSTDSSADLVASYVKADDRVIHVRHDNNCGLPALRVNEGLLMARADVCAYQFDDDQWSNMHFKTLVGKLKKNPSFEVAYGLCQFSLDGNRLTLGCPFDYAQLMATNFISNNSLIHRRSVFERLGGYDMHLLMRRLCDWDLWLRWGRATPFLFVDEVVSIVEAGLAGSLANGASYDLLGTRAHMASDRNARLRPDRLKSYLIDDLDHLKHLGERKIGDIWRQQAAPYKSRFRSIWTTIRPPEKKPTHVLVAISHFDATINITFGNFAELVADDFAFTFFPEAQIDERAIRCADILLLYRTIGLHAEQLAECARKYGKTIVFAMDDDLMSLHEAMNEYAHLAPGTHERRRLESLIQGADFVITYSVLMQKSVEALNPRNVVLKTNIQQKWLLPAKACLAEPAATPRPDVPPMRIGFAGGRARREEFAALWPAVVQASRELGSRAEFLFWGFTPDGLEELQSPSRCEPFTSAYEQYLARLTSHRFDGMIAPLLGESHAKRAKCPIKFLEITAAGAVGVYSDVEPYRAVVDGVTGIKCENTVEAWTAAILKAASLLPVERKKIVTRAIAAVEKDYISEVQAPRVVATLEAALLHGLLKRRGLGKPRIAYFCPAENYTLQNAELAQAFQFEPFLVLPSTASTMAEEIQRAAAKWGIAVAYLPLPVEMEADLSRDLDQAAISKISSWLLQNRIALVHSVTLMREVGVAARALGIPHVASLYATNSLDHATFDHCDVIHSDSFLYANRWAEVLDAPVRRIMSYVPDEYFQDEPSPPAGELTMGMFGTLQPRIGQLQAIEAVGLLKSQTGQHVRLRLYGYDHFYPDYLAACKEMVERYGIADLVSFHGFVPDHSAALREVDVLLSASDWESIPLTILEAMAGGHLVVAPNVGGIGEILSHRTGILMPDNSAGSISNALGEVLKLSVDEWKNKADLAREVIREECSRYKVSAEIFRLYRQAATAHRSQSDRAPGQLNPGARLSDGAYGALEHLRSQLHQINAGLVGRTNGEN
jgi:glycosyltransferase involved in cell wall biosynthesis